MARVGTHLHVVEKSYRKSGAGNSETLKTNNSGKGYGVVYYDPNGASRTGVILEAGVEDGQMVRVVNTADAAETITFATGATSNVSLGTDAVIGRNLQMEFTWSASLARWVPSGGTAVYGDASITSAKIDPTVIQSTLITLTATEIVGTAAGDLGHASGAVLVAAVADYIHEFIDAVLIYDFGVAAYTGGGNDLAIRQGTTAVSDTISSANLLGAAGDKIVSVAQLSAAENVLTANSTLNIASTAWTQPGTAAGVLRIYLRYRTVPAALA